MTAGGLWPMTLLIWIGIALCISQSAMLSGLNLAFFTISRLELRDEFMRRIHISGKKWIVIVDSEN
jgi:hypothetical protein